MPSRALQRPRPRALCSPGPHPARADRRKSWGPRARPQTQGRPLRPAARSRALRFSLRSKPGGRLLLASAPGARSTCSPQRLPRKSGEGRTGVVFLFCRLALSSTITETEDAKRNLFNSPPTTAAP
ncbi:unnamed protein product [Rangifer tarandus platyrhynchus]|uniref:Uncharacterized protein n=1 Tax=Rangifer tarandus platyrhynchus TaxID=3082113 RepID=A0AC59YRY7_RANTA